MHGSYFTSGVHGLHDEATPSEILAAFKSLKRRRWAIEDKRLQVALSLNMIDSERKRKSRHDSSEIEQLCSNTLPSCGHENRD